MAIQLTKGQEDASSAFFTFLCTDAMSFAISGTAGTGKTFLMQYLAERTMKEYRTSCAMLDTKPEYDAVVFTATTNKAAEVLSNTLGTEAQTIHSFLGLTVREDRSTGRTALKRTNSWCPKSRLVVFIDECSMIDASLHAEIKESLRGCKLVYVGDHAQMAPVGERLSGIYEGLDEKTMFTLTEPVRNAGQPPLVALCAQLRETVETGIFKPIEGVDGAIYHLGDEDMQEGLDHMFQDLDPSCRILSFTNSRAQDYNQYVRETVRQRPPELQPGDVMVMVQAYARGTFRLSVESEVEVVTAGPVETCESFTHVPGGEAIDFRTIGIRKDPNGQVYEVKVAEDQAQVVRVIKSFSRRKDWSSYFDLKAAFADMRNKASCTVYKAQGSTYDSVFVDLGNIGTSYDAEQVARMLFVAISRARSTVYLYGQLPPKYHDSKGKPLWDASISRAESSTPSSSTASDPSPIASVI